MWYTSGSGRIEIKITKAQAERGSHSGNCDADIAELLQVPAIRRQLDKYSNEVLAKELYEYGAWDDEQLQDYQENRARILWIASGDIVENMFSKA